MFKRINLELSFISHIKINSIFITDLNSKEKQKVLKEDIEDNFYEIILK